jgi:AcrR family transcriptional regulator
MSTFPELTNARISRPLRSDAARNRARVLASAAELFGTHGTDLSVTEVAKHAGVGKATIYRSFPTKDHLIAAVATEKYAEFADQVLGTVDAPNVADALSAMFEAGAEENATDRLMAEVLVTQPDDLPEMIAVYNQVKDALEVLLEAGRRQGTIRQDATTDDINILFGGISRALHAQGETDLNVWRRSGRLVVDALRPH